MKTELEPGPRTFVVRAAGDAMAPDVRDGDHVRVDPDAPVEPGRAVALRDGESGRAVVLRLAEEEGRLVLRGTLAGVADRPLDAEAQAAILGVAVFAGRRI